MAVNQHLKLFLLLAIGCCLLSVISTIGIHSDLFHIGELSVGEQMRLFENSKYLAGRFWIIIHCLFVVISMLGFLLIQFKKSPGFTVLGFTFFIVFAFTEIFRQMFVLFFLNNLRRLYLASNSNAVQELLKTNIDHAIFIGHALFGLFIVAFALGTICYGISLISRSKLDSLLAFLLLIWGIGNLCAFGNVFWSFEVLNQILEYFSMIYQPVMRLLIGLWMILKYRQIIDGRMIIS